MYKVLRLEFCAHRFLVGLVITMQRSWNTFMYTDKWDFTGTRWKPHNRKSQLLCWECTGVHFHDFHNFWETIAQWLLCVIPFSWQVEVARLIKRATGTINVSNQQSRSEGIRFSIKYLLIMFCILQYNDIFMPNNMIIRYRNEI